MKSIFDENKQWIDETWAKLDKKLKRVAVKSRDKIPYTTVNGEHDNCMETRPTWWTNGFWGGLMWIMYLGTKDDAYQETALRAEKLMDAALEDYKALHHDVGFMWHIVSGVNYRLNGDKKSGARNFYAAATLAARFNITAGYIRAWNGAAGANDGFSIIDCLMNIPQLYWASEEIGDDRFKKIAMAHADMSLRDHVRPDGSVAHIVDHDTQTGEIAATLGGQGFCEGSSWSRGQAWAIYGFALSYIHTGEQRYLDAAKKVAHYFIANVCDDYLPKVDFRAPDEPVYYDTTAGVCAACGLIEISKCVPEHEKGLYMTAAIKLLKAIEGSFCNWEENEDSVLQMGTERYPIDTTNGLHIPIIYGDYFFAEALYKLRGGDFLTW